MWWLARRIGGPDRGSAPLGFDPPLLSRFDVDPGARRFRADCAHVAEGIVVHDRRDFRRATRAVLGGEARHRPDLRREARFQDAGEGVRRAPKWYDNKYARHLYDMPLKVVPTSKARTSCRRGPSYAFRELIAVGEGKEKCGDGDRGRSSKRQEIE